MISSGDEDPSNVHYMLTKGGSEISARNLAFVSTRGSCFCSSSHALRITVIYKVRSCSFNNNQIIFFYFWELKLLSPVVQRADNALYRINCYSENTRYQKILRLCSPIVQVSVLLRRTVVSSGTWLTFCQPLFIAWRGREREDFGEDHNMVFRRNRGGSVVANIVYRSYHRKLILNEGDH